MAPIKPGQNPALEKFISSLDSRPVSASTANLISLLKWRHITGPEPSALATAHLLQALVSSSSWTTAAQLITQVHHTGQRLVAAQPHEAVISNIVKRVLGLIRAEVAENRDGVTIDDAASSQLSSSQPVVKPAAPAPPRNRSFLNFFAPAASSNAASTTASGASTPMLTAQMQTADAPVLRPEIRDGIEEIVDEIRQVDDQLLAYVDTLVHPEDGIMVYAPARGVQRFLMRSKRRFTVFLVLDPASFQDGKEAKEDPYAVFKKTLADNGSKVITVLNVGLSAYMARINKVILAARSLSVNGSAVLDPGAAAIARAAAKMRRGVVVLAGVYKLRPESCGDDLEKDRDVVGDAGKFVRFERGGMVGGDIRIDGVRSESVGAECVGIYVSNLGTHSKDQLPAIVKDHYKPEDIALDLHVRTFA